MAVTTTSGSSGIFSGYSILVFDGSSTLSTAHNTDYAYSTGTDFTVECWVKTSTTTANMAIVSKAASTFASKDFLIRSKGSTGVEVWIYDISSSAAAISSSTNIADGNWHHIALMRNSSGTNDGTHLMVDGAITSITTSWDSSNTNAFLWGDEPINDVKFTGNMADLRVSGRAQYAHIANAVQDPWWDDTIFSFPFQNNTTELLGSTNTPTSISFSTSIKPNDNFTHSAGPINGGKVDTITGGNISRIQYLETAGYKWNIEMYVYHVNNDDWSGQYSRILDGEANSTAAQALRYGNSYGHIGIYHTHGEANKATEAGVTPGTDLPASQWNHLCWQYDGTNTKSFVNGAIITTTAGNVWGGGTTAAWGASDKLKLFHYINGGHAPEDVYFAGMRFTVGTDPSRYDMSGFTNHAVITNPTPFVESTTTYTYTQPTVPFGYGEVVAAVSAYTPKYGNASALFDGDGDILTVASDAKFDLGAGDYSVEAWVKADDLTDTVGTETTTSGGLASLNTDLYGYWDFNNTYAPTYPSGAKTWVKNGTLGDFQTTAKFGSHALDEGGGGANDDWALVGSSGDMDVYEPGISISVWVYYDSNGSRFGSTGPNGTNLIIGTYGGSDNGWTLMTQNEGSAHVVWLYWNGYIKGTTDITALDTWHHIAMTWAGTGNQPKLWLNGSEESVTGTANCGTDNASDICIGAWGTNQSHSPHPFIDGLGLWEKELSTTELATLYNSGTGLVGVNSDTGFVTSTTTTTYDHRTANPVITIGDKLQVTSLADGKGSVVVDDTAVIAGTTVLDDSTWRHVAVSRNSGSTRLFIDGVQEGVTYAGTENIGQGEVRIGHNLVAGTTTSGGFDSSGWGGIVTTVGDYTVHTFLTDGTFKPEVDISADIFVLAGGGGGGGHGGGGGGGGGFRTATSHSLTTNTSPGHTVTVGAGGDGGDPVIGDGAGTNGEDSSVGSFTSSGGGGGGGYYMNNSPAINAPKDGGSGGGTGKDGGAAGGLGNTPSTSPSQGYNGGYGRTVVNSGNGAGGGGGAGAVGGDAGPSEQGAAGGAGASNDYQTGSGILYAGGGGGGCNSVTSSKAGEGGSGGGKKAHWNTAPTNSNDCDDNTGGGGGAGSYGGDSNTRQGGDGGSGIVIIRYLTESTTTTTTVPDDNQYFKGSMDEVRVTKGYSRYNANFTPLTREFGNTTPVATGDPYYDSVVLSLHMNGADASTTFTDSSSTGHTVTAVGDAQIDTGRAAVAESTTVSDPTTTGSPTKTTDGDYTVYTYTSDGTFVPSSALNAEVLVVAGGAAGGASSNAAGGGGGAGGIIHDEVKALTAQSYTVTIGAGGVGGLANADDGEDGGDSFFGDMKAFGGGGGSAYDGTYHDGVVGGSGGGGCGDATVGGVSTQTDNDGGTGYGFAGGAGIYTGGSVSTGGGGGAGEVGADASGTAPGFIMGAGGDGRQFAITGTNLYYAGGGGAGVYKHPSWGWNTGSGTIGGDGGQGGGGKGGDSSGVNDESDGDDGTFYGAGGGGSGTGYSGNTQNHYNGSGYQGVVIIRYLTSDHATTTAAIASITPKFGTGMGLFDGTGDKLTVPSNTEFDFGTGDYTVEGWVKTETTGTPPSIVAGGGGLLDFGGTGGNYPALYMDTTGHTDTSEVQTVAVTASEFGGILTTVGSYNVHTFLASGYFKPQIALTIDMFVLAGGGGGGGFAGGGGGAGGHRTKTSHALAASATTGHTVTVGAGGAGGPGSQYVGAGTSGGDSTLDGFTSTGGGGGGGYANGPTTDPVKDGGSGGGTGKDWRSGQPQAGGLGNTPSTSPSQGNNGGQGTQYPSGAAGGGGKGAVGANSGSNDQGGAGGAGASNDYRTGSGVTYAGGGGGGCNSTIQSRGGAGGTGGGAPGGYQGMAADYTDAPANLGGGGGGSAYPGTAAESIGGDGGSGIIVIRYLTSALTDQTYQKTVTTTGTAANASSVVKYDLAGTTLITGTTNLDDDDWHHLAVSRQSTSTRMYVDGVQEGSTAVDSPSATTLVQNGITIGEKPGSTTTVEYKVHTFTANGTFTVSGSAISDIEYLVVGGGGGGGARYAGGGGAGGYRTNLGGTKVTTAVGNVTITIGAKGAKGTASTPASAYATEGGDSSAAFSSGTISATGGGRGLQYNQSAGPNSTADGGSGGGGTFQSGTIKGSGNEGSYTPVEGYDGGTSDTTKYHSGGGGGSSAVGANATTTAGGDGGAGTSNAISGTATVYAGGGGGARSYETGTPGSGGTGGGGAGGSSGVDGVDASGYGSGGGGGFGSSDGSLHGAGDGSAGIVIIRYPSSGNSATGGTVTTVSDSSTVAAVPYNGRLDDWRITKGVARYTEAFGLPVVQNYDITAAAGIPVGDNLVYSTGRVGIGNTSPGYTLDVTGALNVTGGIYSAGVKQSLGTVSVSLYADLPVASDSNVGALYLVSSTSKLYWSNGSTWVAVGSAVPSWTTYVATAGQTYTTDMGQLDYSDGETPAGNVTHTAGASGVAGSGDPQPTTTFLATDPATDVIIYDIESVEVTDDFDTESGSVVGAISPKPTWISVASDGKLSITPDHAYLGDELSIAGTASDGSNVLTKNFTFKLSGGWPAQDEYWTDVHCLLSMVGSSHAERVAIRAGATNPWETPVHAGSGNDDTWSSSYKKFGDVSIDAVADGSGLIGWYDFSPYAKDMNFTNASFTIEAWIYLDSHSVGNTGTNNYAFPCIFHKGYKANFGVNNGVLTYGYYNTSSNWVFVTHQTTVTTGAWHHVAVTVDYPNTDLYLFVDGVKQTSAHTWQGQQATASNAGQQWIGTFSQGGNSAAYLRGYIGEFRVTETVARYTADFEVPAGAFQTS